MKANPPRDAGWSDAKPSRPRSDAKVLQRRRSTGKARVAALADHQVGRVAWSQLRRLGVGDGTIRRWRDDAYLFWELPGVYAVGHPGRSVESDLAAALLYAGPGAMLSHGTAVWWLELLKYPPPQIHVSSPRRVKDRDNIVVHGRRTIDRIWHNRLPVTTPSQAIVDFAASDEPDLLRLVLANADFKQLLDVATLQASIGQGVHGTRAVREALEIHLPQLALARSRPSVSCSSSASASGSGCRTTSTSLSSDTSWTPSGTTAS